MFIKFPKKNLLKSKAFSSFVRKNTTNKKLIGYSAIIVPTALVANMFARENSLCKEKDVKELEKERKELDRERKDLKTEIKELKEKGEKKIKEGADKYISKENQARIKDLKTEIKDLTEKAEKKIKEGADKVFSKDTQARIGDLKTEIRKLKGKGEKKIKEGADKLFSKDTKERISDLKSEIKDLKEKGESKSGKYIEKLDTKKMKEGAENALSKVDVKSIEEGAEKALAKVEAGADRIKEIGIRHPFIVSSIAGAVSGYAILSFGKVMILGAALTFFGVKYVESYGYAKFNWDKVYNKGKDNLVSTITSNPGTTMGFSLGLLAALYLRQKHFSIFRSLFSSKKPVSN